MTNHLDQIVAGRLSGVPEHERLSHLRAWMREVGDHEVAAARELDSARARQAELNVAAVAAGKSVSVDPVIAESEAKRDAWSTLAAHIQHAIDRIESSPRHLDSLRRRFGEQVEAISHRVWQRQAEAVRAMLPLISDTDRNLGQRRDAFRALFLALGTPRAEQAAYGQVLDEFMREVPASQRGSILASNGLAEVRYVIGDAQLEAVLGESVQAAPDAREAALAEARARRASRVRQAPGAAA